MDVATILLMVLLAIYFLGIMGSCFLLFKVTGGVIKIKLYLLAPIWPVFFAMTLIGFAVFWEGDPKPAYD